MELVEATRDDVDVLAEYWFALASEMEQYDGLNRLAVDGPAAAVEGIEGLLDDDETAVFLIAADGEPVGYLLLREIEHPSREHSERVDVVDLFVEADHRGRGIGSDAVEAAVDTARDWGADQITVSCEWHNDGARRFYEDNGFNEKQVTYARRLE